MNARTIWLILQVDLGSSEPDLILSTCTGWNHISSGHAMSRPIGKIGLSTLTKVLVLFSV